MEEELWKKIVQLSSQEEWFIVVFILLCILSWEVLKSSIPKVFSYFLGLIQNRFHSQRNASKQETKIRNFVLSRHRANWVSNVRSISSFHADVPLDAVYFPLRYSLNGSRINYNEIGIDKILEENLVFCIIGSPGSGKSTVLNMLAIAYAGDTVENIFNIKEVRLPLFIKIKNIDIYQPLPKLLAASYDVSELFVEKQLVKKRCIVILDGLDEIGDELKRRDVTEWISINLARYTGNRFVISCRTLEWDTIRIPLTPSARILDLSPIESDSIVKRWHTHFHNTKISLNKVASNLLTNPQSTLHSFFKNPLLLTLLTILEINGINVPDTKTKVYEIFVRVLLGEWEEIKGAQLDKTVDEKLKIFQAISLFILSGGFLNEEINLNNPVIEEFISSQIFTKYGVRSEQWLSKLARESIIIAETGEKNYQFLIRGILEFLAAREIYQERSSDLIIKNFTKDYWQETIVLYYLHFKNPGDAIRNLQYRFEKDIIYYRVIASIASNLKNSEKDRNILSLQLQEFLVPKINDSTITQELFLLAFRIEPLYWLNTINLLLFADESSEGKLKLIELLCQFDTPESINLVNSAVNKDNNLAKFAARALRHSTLPVAKVMLWELIESPDVEVSKLAEESIYYKGESMVENCKFIILHKGSNRQKLIAIQALVELKSPSIISYLLNKIPELPENDAIEILAKVNDSHVLLREDTKFEKLIDATWIDKAASYLLFKRSFDIVFSILVLIFLSPVMLMIALTIKFLDRGPAFIRRVRIGADGKRIKTFQFRTMKYHDKDSETLSRSTTDPRISPFGRFLRQSSLEELPLFINVLIGDISVVGPRLLSIYEAELISYPAMNVKSGITGLAQVRNYYQYNSYDPFRHYMYDLEYYAKLSPFLDVKIVWATIFQSAKRKQDNF